MAKQYKTVDTNTIKGLQKAERLQSNGWKPISISLDNKILLEKNK